MPPQAPADPRGSMSLLVDMTGAALDPSYAEAALRKAGGSQPVRTSRLSVRLLVGMLVVGLATGVLGVQARRHAGQLGIAQRSLEADVRARTAVTDALAAQAAALQAHVAALRQATLSRNTVGRSAAAELAALELATGGAAVHGPGLVVSLSDAPNDVSGADPRGGQGSNGRIYDRDVQDVVNALWASGAEAVSVNNQRVTALTAIRSAGEAVLVDLRPLSSPYQIRAVGDVNALESTFVDSATARRFKTWTSLYGLGFQVHRASDLVLPAAGAPVLRAAEPLASSTSTPGGGS
jgi:uncharacterized protein YlxW (UPF0749 family)